MKIWFIIEEKLNNIICQIQTIFRNRILYKIKPDKKNEHEKNFISDLNRTIFEYVTSFKQMLIWFISQLNPFKLLRFIPELISSSFQLMGLWISSLRHLDVIIVSIVLFMSAKISYDKYKLLKQDVITKMNTEGHNTKYVPLSRPIYYKKYDKQFSLYNIRIPIHHKKLLPKQIIMDFSVETSNKYLKEYLSKNIHLVKDRFNNTIQPIISELPIEKRRKNHPSKKTQNGIK